VGTASLSDFITGLNARTDQLDQRDLTSAQCNGTYCSEVVYEQSGNKTGSVGSIQLSL